jgi:hypothetical protein
MIFQGMSRSLQAGMAFPADVDVVEVNGSSGSKIVLRLSCQDIMVRTKLGELI